MKHLTTLRTMFAGVVLFSSPTAMADEDEVEGKKYAIRNSSILMPMVQYEKIKERKRGYQQYDILAKMILDIKEGHKGVTLILEPRPGDFEVREEIEEKVEGALRDTYGDVEEIKAFVKTNKTYSRVNESSMSGPLAVMLGASLENKQMLPGLTVCFDIQSASQLARPKDFWRQLKGLRNSSKPHRVLVSSATEVDFTQLVAINEFNFFILNEVVIVKSLGDAVKSSYTGGNEKLLAASKVFAQIQEVAAKRPIATIISHPQMKAKLGEVLRLYPNHLSAKMLLLGGERKGVKPDGLSSSYAAHELKSYLRQLEDATYEVDAYDEEAHDRRRLAARLKPIAQKMEDDLTKFRTYLRGDMKTNCDTLRKDIPEALKSWIRSLNQPEAAYHRKNSYGQRNKIEKLVKGLNESFERAINEGGDEGGNKAVANPDNGNNDSFNDDNN